MKRLWWSLALSIAGIGSIAVAADRDDYNRRSAERYVAMFRLNDVNRDDVVTRQEVGSTIDLAATFDDIDIDRNGDITWAELTRYVDANFR